MLFASIYANAQSYKILDKESKEPIPYANICFESVSGKKSFTISDLSGNFKYKLEEKSKIAISYLGYQTLIDTIIPGKSKIFYLQSDVFNINQVVVTATRTPKALKDAPVLTQLIPARQIQTQAITNVQNVLEQEIPGMKFNKAGFGTDINMQGVGSKNILILIDGEPMAGEIGNNVDYSRINLDNIDHIEIVKGASSSLYGSKAMGGVINIITKNPRKKLEIHVGGKITERNQVNFHDVKYNDENYFYKQKLDLPNTNSFLNVGFNVKKISGLTEFNYKSFDAYKLTDKYAESFHSTNIDTIIKTGPNTTYIDGYEDYSLSQKLNFNLIKNLEIKLKASYYKHNQYDFAQDNKFWQYSDLNYSAIANYRYNENVRFNASFYRDSYNKYNFYEKLGEKDLNYNEIYTNPKLSSIVNIGNAHTVSTGLELLNDYLLSDKFIEDTLTAKSVNTSVFYLQDEYDINKKINLTAGGRVDYHTEFGLHFSPKISFMYKWHSHRFRFNYANGFRSPSLKELYMDWNLLGMFIIKGDKNLKPETNQYFSFSGEYTKNNFNGSVSTYYNMFKNKIDGIWTNNQTVYQYTNLNNVNIFGVEVLLRYHFLNHFNMSGGYSFINSNQSSENSMSTASPHNANFRFEYIFRRKAYNLNVNLSAIYTGAKNYDTYEEILYNGEYQKAWYNVSYKSYTMWNFSISQRFYNAIQLVLGVDNLLNYKPDIINFNTAITPGRRVFVSLKLNIDNFFNKQIKTNDYETN